MNLQKDVLESVISAIYEVIKVSFGLNITNCYCGVEISRSMGKDVSSVADSYLTLSSLRHGAIFFFRLYLLIFAKDSARRTKNKACFSSAELHPILLKDALCAKAHDWVVQEHLENFCLRNLFQSGKFVVIEGSVVRSGEVE